MLNKLNSLLTGRVSVFKNFLALGILQGTNFIIPLLIMPYLIKVIGVENYGIVSFAQVVMIYFFCFTDYGFTITATQEISIHRDNREKLSEVFSKVVSTKTLLVLASAFFMTILLFLVPDIKEEELTFILGFTLVIGQTTLPVWFFQGVEKMKYITYINLMAKILFMLMIFIFIKEREHYPYVLLFFGLGNLISGILGLFYAKRQYQLSFKWASFSEIKLELKKGWSLFVANFAITSYMNSNLFVLKLFTNNTIVGYYSIAEKIIMALRQILVVFSQAIFPHVCVLAEKSYLEVQKFYRQIYFPFTVIVFFITVGVYYFSEEVIGIFVQEEIEPINSILELLVIVPFIVSLNIAASQTLLVYNFRKNYTTVMVLGSVLNIILNVALVSSFAEKGTAISVLITELFITTGLIYYARSKMKKLKN